jgi:hypothetical protein
MIELSEKHDPKKIEDMMFSVFDPEYRVRGVCFVDEDPTKDVDIYYEIHAKKNLFISDYQAVNKLIKHLQYSQSSRKEYARHRLSVEEFAKEFSND